MLRHLAFFEALAEFADDTAAARDSDMQDELAAAILVLRFFDAWVDCPAIAGGMSEGTVLIKQRIAAVRDSSAQHLLATMVSEMLRWNGYSPASVVVPFLAYAWTLEERDHLELATDVLQTVAEVVDPLRGPVDYSTAAYVHRRLGDIAHQLRQFGIADTKYARQLALANTVEDQALALDARTRRASLSLTQGNLGNAEASLTAVIDQAQSAGFQREEAYARRVRGSTRLRRGHADTALRDFYAAYLIAPDHLEQDWLLGDMAGCAALLGRRDTARLIYQALARTAHRSSVQTLALVNLLDIAVQDNDQETFQTVWKELMRRPLARDLELHALLYRAQGIELWDSKDVATTAYSALVDDAREAGVHDIEFQALEMLRRLSGELDCKPAALTPQLAVAPPPVPEWGNVAEAIEAVCLSRLHATGVTP